MGMFGSAGQWFKGLGTAGPEGVSTADKLAALASAFSTDPDARQAGAAAYGDKKSAYAQKSQIDQILAQVLGTNAPGVGTAEIVKPPRAMIGRGPGFMPQSQMPGPMGPLPPGVTPQLPTRDEINMPGVASMSGGVDLGAPVKQPTPMGLDNPQLPALALAAKRAGLDLSSYIEILKANQPDIHYDRGFGYNGKTGASAGGYHPDLEKGQEPLYDRSGNVVGVRNMDGSIQAAADMAGAVSGAQERAKAGYDLVAVPQSDGSTRMMPRLSAVGALGGGAAGDGPPSAAGRGGGSQLGVSQTPAAASAAKIQGDAQATAQTTLPSDISGVDAAIENVNKLIADPGLKQRTGAWAMLPAIPGTHGVAVDALKKQIGGQIFLDAFTTLKGGGQITEVEGNKATQAKARMDSAQTYEDYVAAAKEYVGALKRGRALLMQKAGGGRPAATPNRSAVEAEMRRRGLIR